MKGAHGGGNLGEQPFFVGRVDSGHGRDKCRALQPITFQDLCGLFGWAHGQCFQDTTDPRPHLCCGLLGVGERKNFGGPNPREKAADNSRREKPSLAASRAGLHHNRARGIGDQANVHA